MPTKKAGHGVVKTRAARRQIVPAIEPGSLESTADGKSPLKQRLYRALRTLTNYYSHTNIPSFSQNTKHLDAWLQSTLNDERTGFLAAFVDQASMIQSNLHYRLVGSKSLVQRTLDLLHASEGGEGFRKLIKLTALNFYCTNFGGAVYLDRTEPVIPSYLPDLDKWYWSTPPVQAMYATDSTLFIPNSDYIYPYSYDGQPWSRYDFFRIVSMPSTQLATWGIGRCPLYRCIQIARMTSATYEHIYNTLSPDTAKGIVTVKGMTGDEFLASLSGSEAVNEGDTTFRAGFTGGDALGDIVVLADRDDEIVVKFVTLSRLPDGFFVDQWVRWTLTSFATNLGFPLEEFIGMPANRLLGQSGAEVSAGQQRGATKGGRDFINGFQDALASYAVPDSVLLEFAERDESAELNDLDIRSKKAKIVLDLFTGTQLAIINKGDQNADTLIEARAAGEHLISKEEGRALLDAWDVLPFKLTTQQNASLVIDDSIYSLDQARLKELRDKVRDSKQVKRLAAEPTSEPVVMYESWVDQATGFMRERETVLWEDDSELGRPSVWAVPDLGVSMPVAGWQRVRTRKKIMLTHALDSQHTADLMRLMRKAMLMPDNLDKKSLDALVSRVYALCQIGRDNVLGPARLSDTALAELASKSLEYARRRVDVLLGKEKVLKGNTPLTPPLEAGLVEEMQATVEMAKLTAEKIAEESGGDVDQITAQLVEEALRPRVRTLAEDEAAYAYCVGQYLAGLAVNARTKTWRTGACECKGHDIDGESVKFEKVFSGGAFWSSNCSGCGCEIEVN